MAKGEINLQYIRKVLKFIESDLRRFEMSVYKLAVPLSVARNEPETYAECGTQACFAGWGVLLQFPKSQWHRKAEQPMSPGDVSKKAAQLFGFTPTEARSVFQGNGVCHLDQTVQLEYLKSAINRVLKDRGIEERV